MGKSKRKLFTSMTAFALVAVMSVGAVIAVFASLMAHVESSFNISYTARNVECIVTGTYSQRYGLQNQSLGSPIVFTAESPDTPQTFDIIPNINFEGPQDFLEFHFTIQNTGENGFNVSIALENFNNSNFKAEYTNAGRATGNTNPKFDFENNSKAKLMDSYVTAKGSTKEYLDIGVRISLIGSPTVSASASGMFNFNLDGIAEGPADLWDDDLKLFNKQNLDKLLQTLSADPNASTTNMAKINEMAAAANDFNIAGCDAENFRNNNNGEDIIVTLGGLTWNACYLSKDTQGNIILTLWLTSSQQKFFEGMSATEGEFYGYLDGSLYSDWSANWSSSSTSLSYPSSMYGTSYIRAVTLNNGGSYSTSGGESLLTYTKNKESLFALFTVEDLGLTDYIVKPKDVAWQEYGQSAKGTIGQSYNLPNENWSSDLEKVPDTGFSGSGYNYAHKGEYNSAWANDYLWLPSLSETGYNSGTHGLWQLDVAQRKNGSFSSTSSVGNVGQTSGAAYNYSWLRSGYRNPANYSYYLGPSGSDYNFNGVHASDAVRPALHLNLTKIANELAAQAASVNNATPRTEQSERVEGSEMFRLRTMRRSAQHDLTTISALDMTIKKRRTTSFFSYLCKKDFLF